MLGHEWDGLVIAANDVGAHWPRRLDHWATLHPEKLDAWLEVREANGYDVDVQTWSRNARGRKAPRKTRRPHKYIEAIAAGASGLLAVAVALEVRCTRVVLCGVPMTATPHFAESTVHQTGKNWTSAHGHWKAWKTERTKARLMGRVKSMSGQTRDLLGEPTLEWLAESEAP